MKCRHCGSNQGKWNGWQKHKLATGKINIYHNWYCNDCGRNTSERQPMAIVAQENEQNQHMSKVCDGAKFTDWDALTKYQRKHLSKSLIKYDQCFCGGFYRINDNLTICNYLKGNRPPLLCPLTKEQWEILPEMPTDKVMNILNNKNSSPPTHIFNDVTFTLFGKIDSWIEAQQKSKELREKNNYSVRIKKDIGDNPCYSLWVRLKDIHPLTPTDKVSKTIYNEGNLKGLVGYRIRIPMSLIRGMGYKNNNLLVLKAIAKVIREINNDHRLLASSVSVRDLKDDGGILLNTRAYLETEYEREQKEFDKLSEAWVGSARDKTLSHVT